MKMREKLMRPIAVGVLTLGVLACKSDSSPPSPSAWDVIRMEEQIQHFVHHDIPRLEELIYLATNQLIII
jgi:hypothetical protein